MPMFIARRLLSGVVLVFVISFVAFSLLYASGGDIARRLLGQTASEETVARKAEQLGLDRPLLSQYGDWLSWRSPAISAAPGSPRCPSHRA